jgi:hypothetical protein
VEPGNDPGRDEYGLPPVDVEIPDDARDLDRDVQAYYRELRARRRRVRIRRVTGPLTRHGMVLPLVAACLALTLLTGSLLTVLSGRQVPLMRSRPLTPPTQGISASRGRQLPDAQVVKQHHYVPLRTLAPAVLAWVPPGCLGCGRILRQLARQATAKHVHFYFVGAYPTNQGQRLSMLLNQVGPKYKKQFVNDYTNALSAFYGLTGVTAILAHSRGWVEGPDVVQGLFSRSGQQEFTARLNILAIASAGATAGSSGPPQHPVPQSS